MKNKPETCSCPNNGCCNKYRLKKNQPKLAKNFCSNSLAIFISDSENPLIDSSLRLLRNGQQFFQKTFALFGQKYQKCPSVRRVWGSADQFLPLHIIKDAGCVWLFFVYPLRQFPLAYTFVHRKGIENKPLLQGYAK